MNSSHEELLLFGGMSVVLQLLCIDLNSEVHSFKKSLFTEKKREILGYKEYFFCIFTPFCWYESTFKVSCMLLKKKIGVFIYFSSLNYISNNFFTFNFYFGIINIK